MAENSCVTENNPDRCCRVEVNDIACPKLYANLSEATVPGYGCDLDPDRESCHLCPCADYCCPLGWVCNGLRGTTRDSGVHKGEWYCQEFYEETADPFIWPLLLLICLVFPLVYFLRKVCAFVCGLFEEGVRLKSLPWSTLVYHISVSIVESLVPFWLS